ncbi:hypothetical protein B296_00040838 [Ensete ventricosum]|uniref:Uncharacterized protein n=1 Tax=Ensete ventricosum TaxID=4639 RepID=A0A426XW28_ENSVE|nr:hypothetical protein B296_00040838 [Ensete ventricosum]
MGGGSANALGDRPGGGALAASRGVRGERPPNPARRRRLVVVAVVMVVVVVMVMVGVVDLIAIGHEDGQLPVPSSPLPGIPPGARTHCAEEAHPVSSRAGNTLSRSQLANLLLSGGSRALFSETEGCFLSEGKRAASCGHPQPKSLTPKRTDLGAEMTQMPLSLNAGYCPSSLAREGGAHETGRPLIACGCRMAVGATFGRGDAYPTGGWRGPMPTESTHRFGSSS